jgi:hypothetical protein
LTSLPIFISETDLAPLDGSGYETIPDFISDLCSDGGDGVLQFQDGTPALSSTQWTELDDALASDCSSSGGSPTPSPSPSPTPSPSPSPTPGSCATAAPATAPTGFSADVQGSYVVLSWDAVTGASEYEISVDLPDGDLWRESIVTTNSATYDVVPTTGTYTYKVNAVNSVGIGPWSGTQSFTVTQ